MDARIHDGLPRSATVALHDPSLQATVADIEFAHTVLVVGCEPVDDIPILDLRIRKGVRRHNVALAIASARPSSLDSAATVVERFAPGEEAHFLSQLVSAARRTKLWSALRKGPDVVIVYGERVLAHEGGAVALIELADALGLRDREGAGLIGVPATTNGRGLREVGFHPFADGGLTTAEMSSAALSALWLHGVDPLTDLPDRGAWDRALGESTVLAHSAFLTQGVREHAQVVFPLESSAEKDGTIVHPDGRLQRLRQAIAHQGHTRAGWWVLSELGKRLGTDVGALTGPMVSKAIFETIPFYAGLSLDEIGGRGVHWPQREAASAWPTESVPKPAPTKPVAAANGRLRLGTFNSIWSGAEVNASPALRFLKPATDIELSPADAKRLELRHGQNALVEGVRCNVVLRDSVPQGSVFLAGNAVADGLVEVLPA